MKIKGGIDQNAFEVFLIASPAFASFEDLTKALMKVALTPQMRSRLAALKPGNHSLL